MQKIFLYFYFGFFSLLSLQVAAQGTIVPADKGRFIDGHELNQSSGLFYEGYNSFITHNDQGNSTTRLYRFQPTTGTTNVTILDTIDISSTNLDWEDLASNGSDKLYICDTGKNCNASSAPDCPSKFIFKILEIPIASLHSPGLEPIIPTPYYFVYPKLGTCTMNDTVFANVEACVYRDGHIYLFTKDIWSKNTNNCGSWDANFSYRFRLPLTAGSSPANPIVVEYLDSFKMEVIPGEPYADKKPLSASLSPTGNLLAISSATRVWLFYNFNGQDWFDGSVKYLDYVDSGGNKVSRGYEAMDFISEDRILLGVDGNNSRVQELNLAGQIDYGQVGIGTTNPQKPLHVKGGDVYIDHPGGGMIMKADNGSCFKVTVNSVGTLVTQAVACP